MSKAQSVSKEIHETSKALLEKLGGVQQDLQVYMQTLKNSEASVRQRLAKEQKQREEEALAKANAEAERLQQERLAREAKEQADRAKAEEALKQAAQKETLAKETPVKEEKTVAPKQEASVKEKAPEAVQKEEKTPMSEVAAKAEEKPATEASNNGTRPAPEFRRPVQQNDQRTAPQTGYQGNRPQGDRPQTGYQGNRPQGDRPQTGYQGNRPQGDRPQTGYQGNRPQGDRPQTGYQGNRPQGDRPQTGYQGTRPQGDRPQGGYQGGNQGNRPQGARPQGSFQGQRSAGGPGRLPMPNTLLPTAEKEKVSNYDPNKKLYSRPNHDSDEKKALSKKERLNQAPGMGDDDENIRFRKRKPIKVKPKFVPIVIEHAVMSTELISLKELSEKLGKPVADIIKKLFLLGIMATINNEIDYDTAALVAVEYGIDLEYKLTKTYEEAMTDAVEEAKTVSEGSVTRPPVVAIMGHVDHGKTSLLDVIRKTHVTAQEAGGITQHIGAYVVKHNDKQITFLDTPGHEAFTAMRARGAQATDIVILVVAADDGIMPQTVEAINHAKAAKVPIIIAITKMDKPNAEPERVKQELTKYEIVAEEWGGDAIIVPVSSVTKQGIDTLLEMILLLAEVEDYKADPELKAKGTIIEAKLDKGRGPVATVLVQNGTLKIGDTIVAGTVFGRVRAMMNETGARVDEAGPSIPVEVLGLNEVPEAGDLLYATEDDKLSRQVAEERRENIKYTQIKAKAKASLDDLFQQIKDGEIKELNLIIKADVQGSVEAVKQALEKLSTDEVRVNAIHGGVGAITGSDVMLAAASNAIIIGFNVRPDNMAKTIAEQEKVDVRTYRIIYNAIDDVQAALKGMRTPEFKEVILGHAEVRTTFKVPGATIGGCYVHDGKIQRNASARLLRDNIVIHEGTIDSLKRFKDDVKEVATNYECGIGLVNFNDLKDGDVIEAFVMEEIKKG